MDEDYLFPEVEAGWKRINDQRLAWSINMLLIFDHLDSSRLLIMKDEGDFIAQCELVRWAVSDFNYHADLLLESHSDQTDLRFDLLFGRIRFSIGSIADHAPKLLLPIFSVVSGISTAEWKSREPNGQNTVRHRSIDIENWTLIIRQFFESDYADAVAVEHGLIHRQCKVALDTFAAIDKVQTTAEAQFALIDLASTCSSLGTLSEDTAKHYDNAIPE